MNNTNDETSELHPNHKLNIENTALEFLSAWFTQDIKNTRCMAKEYDLSDEATAGKQEELLKKLQFAFDSYNAFTNPEFNIVNVVFDFKNDVGMGRVDGDIKYNAILENNEEIMIAGVFQLYVVCEHGPWTIYEIVFPGV